MFKFHKQVILSTYLSAISDSASLLLLLLLVVFFFFVVFYYDYLNLIFSPSARFARRHPLRAQPPSGPRAHREEAADWHHHHHHCTLHHPLPGGRDHAAYPNHGHWGKPVTAQEQERHQSEQDGENGTRWWVSSSAPHFCTHARIHSCSLFCRLLRSRVLLSAIRLVLFPPRAWTLKAWLWFV